MNKRIRKRPSRFDNVSDAEIQARWRALQPMAIKWLIICVVAAPGLFLTYHYWQPGPQITYLFSLAFRIAIGGAGMFAFLTCLSWYFSKQQPHS
jgi:hypothetical protein